jgi:hypothetical protein
MEKYRVVPLKRDRIAGWVVEQTYPREPHKPRMLYMTQKQALDVADWLNAKENEKISQE